MDLLNEVETFEKIIDNIVDDIYYVLGEELPETDNNDLNLKIVKTVQDFKSYLKGESLCLDNDPSDFVDIEYGGPYCKLDISSKVVKFLKSNPDCINDLDIQLSKYSYNDYDEISVINIRIDDLKNDNEVYIESL